MLSAPKFCQLTGITYRIVDYWDRTGVLTPARPAGGSGTQRGYTNDQVRIGRALRRLRLLGASVAVLRAVVSQLQAAIDNDEAWPTWVAVDHTGRFCGKTIPPEGGWLLTLGAAQEKTKAA